MSARSVLLWALLTAAAPVFCRAQVADSNSGDAVKQSPDQNDELKKSVKEDAADEKDGFGSLTKKSGTQDKSGNAAKDSEYDMQKHPADGGADSLSGLGNNPGVNAQPSAVGPPSGAIGGGRGTSTSRSADSAPPPADPEVQAQQAQRQERTTRRAQAMASALRNSLNPFDAPAGGTPSQARGPAVTSERPAPAAGPSPSRPANKADLLLASISGFGGAFKALGMRAERGPAGDALILNKSGAPATDKELSALSARIQAEPEALMRRPDFFDVLPREHFNELKEDYRARPDLRQTAFKDIELSPPERDFLRSASCERMSGDCNKFTTQMSYRKGETVPPEDLNNIWGAIRTAVQEDDDQFGAGEFDKDDDAKAAEAKRKGDFARKMLFGGRVNLDAARRRLAGFLGPLGGFLGAGEGAAAAAPSQAPQSRPSERGWGPRQAVRFTAQAGRRQGALPPRAAPPAPRRKAPSLLWLLLAASAGAASFAAARRLKSPAS